MSDLPKHPLLYQVNTRVWLNKLSQELGRPATLDDIGETELMAIAELGFDWVYFLGVWQTGQIGQSISRQNPEWRAEYQHILPDLQEDDVCGSPFAITSYTAHQKMGGDEALGHLYQRLQKCGLRLMLDFVPNHTAIDHPWAWEHPEYYVSGSPNQQVNQPLNYIRVQTASGERILAHGRDPYFPGWPDTLQLNYGNEDVAQAMLMELLKILQYCDGLRCDMAMLILPEIFQRTWGIDIQPFWPRAIQAVRKQKPEFTFMAEVYWDMEAELLEQGFNFAYDKRLYDLLRQANVEALKDHLHKPVDYQSHLVRFLENHDEARAASIFPPDQHQAAAWLTYLAPGLAFIHQGQLLGYQKKISVHLCRAPEEETDLELQAFSANLLTVLRRVVVREGDWMLIDAEPSQGGQPGYQNWIIYAWAASQGVHLLVVVNYSSASTQGILHLPINDKQGEIIHFSDLYNGGEFDIPLEKVISDGIVIELPAWGYQILEWQVS